MPALKLRQETVRTVPYRDRVENQCVYWDEELDPSVCGCTRAAGACMYVRIE